MATILYKYADMDRFIDPASVEHESFPLKPLPLLDVLKRVDALAATLNGTMPTFDLYSDYLAYVRAYRRAN